jgi:hypothetical protein
VIRTLALAAAALLAPQDDDVAKQIARISATDPDASWDAVARLLDSKAPRAALEAAAEKIPADAAFYKSALLEEAKAREGFGEKFGRPARVTLEAKGKTPAAVIADLVAQSKQEVDLAWAPDQGASGEVTVQLADAPFLAALAEICRQGNLRPYLQGDSLVVYGGKPQGAFAYRNFLAMLDLSRVWEVSFGSPAKKYLALTVTVLSDRGIQLLRSSTVELLEAVDDAGKALEILPSDSTDAEKDRVEAEAWITNAVWAGGGSMPGRVTPPGKDAAKLVRVRGFVTVELPAETKTIALEAGKEVKPDDGLIERVTAKPAAGDQGMQWTVTMKPKAAPREFEKTPIQFRLKTKDGTERPCWASGKIAGDAVEYGVNAQATPAEMRTGQMPQGEALLLVVHRKVATRRIPFEFRDVALK